MFHFDKLSSAHYVYVLIAVLLLLFLFYVFPKLPIIKESKDPHLLKLKAVMTCVNESTGTKIVSGIFIALVLILSMGLAEECRVRGMCAGPAMFAGQAGPVATGVPPPASFRFRG